MKKSILLLTFSLTFIFSQNLLAQDSNGENQNQEKYSEVGINATSFINEFISLNSNDADVGDYMISYKYHFGGKALRFGLGGNFSQSDEDTDGNGSRKTSANSFDIRMGYEWNKIITKRWAFYTGVDIIGGTDLSSSVANTFEVVETSTRVTTFGGGPVLGIQFFINSHISLMTEGNLYYKHSITNTKTTSSLNPEFDDNETSNSNISKFGLPTALFFVIRF